MNSCIFLWFMQNQIFDIQTFSLHDGPGIRTTVFLKACPLRCQWCSNPEGLELKANLSYQEKKCTHCLICTTKCPTGALSSKNGNLVVQHELCNACGLCIDSCPTQALKLYGYESDAQKIINRVKKDKLYFDNSGGGITLSGGEVMMQPKFTLQLLELAKDAGIHTCIETSGYGKQEDYEKVLPFVDLFLFDYKLTDPEEHKKYSGKSNQLILENLKFLNKKGAKINLRLPLIKGINDNAEHFQAIVDLSNRYENIENVEIMPYHNWGEHKYKEIGLKTPDIKIGSATEKDKEQWETTLLEMGCKKLINR